MIMRKKIKKEILSIIILSYLIILCCDETFSQTAWSNLYGGENFDEALSVVQTIDGNYIIVGYSWSFAVGEYDMWIFKIAPDGNIIWQNTYGGTYADLATSILKASDGGYIILGNTNSFGAGESDAWIIKIDESGNIIWQKRYGTNNADYLYSIQPAIDGGYIAAGYTYSSIANSQRVWILKIDLFGNIVWQKIYNRSNNDFANSIAPTKDGGYIVACQTYSPSNGWIEPWILKLDNTGNILWQKIYSAYDDDSLQSIQQTKDGGYIAAGYTTSFGSGLRDGLVLKLDSSGNIAWQKAYGGTHDDFISAIQQTSDDGYVIAGYSISFGSGFKDVWVIKIDSFGNIVWQKFFGELQDDWANSVKQTADNGYIISGYTLSFGAGSSDAWVLKLDSVGNLDPVCSFVQDSNAMATGANATIISTNIAPVSGSAIALNTTASALISNAINIKLCSILPGTVPDNDNYPGNPLLISKVGANLQLSWGAPAGNCITENYAIYRGSLPLLSYDHTSLLCSTGGSTSATVPADLDNYYYLITAIINNKEGSYGLDSSGIQRPPGVSQCFPQAIGTCN